MLMRAALLEKEKTFRIIEVANPEPGKDEVVIQVLRTGICGSEIEAFYGRHPFRKPPVITGHEMSGVISKIGEGVTGFRLGERVTLEPQVACGSCTYCRTGRYNLCRGRMSLGTAKWPGPFGEFIKAPASTLIRIPDGLSMDEAVLLEPLAVGFHAVRRTRLGRGESLVVFGGGTIGLCVMAAAMAIGVDPIIITDISEPKLKIAGEMGARLVVNPRTQNLLEEVKQLLPEGADVAIVATGVPGAYRSSTKVVRRDGRVGVVGLCREEILTPIDIGGPGPELEVIGCTAYVNVDFRDAMGILPEGKLGKLISRVYPIERIQEAFETFIRENDTLIKVILSHR